jgi:hypothetical protein
MAYNGYVTLRGREPKRGETKMKKAERIIANLPKNANRRICALEVLIGLCKGEHAHIYYGWTNRYRRLTKASGVSPAMEILYTAGIAYEKGNDAPRGGVLGEYVKLVRRIPSAVPVLEEELRKVKEK